MKYETKYALVAWTFITMMVLAVLLVIMATYPEAYAQYDAGGDTDAMAAVTGIAPESRSYPAWK